MNEALGANISPFVLSVTIPNGTTTSDAQALGGNTLCGIIFPYELTGSTISFEVSVDGVDYVTLKKVEDGGTAYTIAKGSHVAVPLLPSTWAAWRYVRVVSASAEGGDRIFQLVTRLV